MWEQIKGLGLSHEYAVTLSVALTLLLFLVKKYIESYIERKNKAYELKLEIDCEKIKEITGLINTIRKLLTDYDHFVMHVSEGHKISYYKPKIIKQRCNIRERARELSAIIDKDYPSFLEKVYEVSDYGEKIKSTGCTYRAFAIKYNELRCVFDDIERNLTKF